MKLLALVIAIVLTAAANAQTESVSPEAKWKESLDALNKEYFEKLRKLQAEHIALLETLKTDAMKNERLDDAIGLRDQIESFKSELGTLTLPDDNGKLSKEKARLANLLSQSKWDCSANPNLPKWAGTHLIFHENGTVVPANDQNAKLPLHRWAVLDGRTIVAMLGDYQMIFRLNDKGNALNVLEVGNTIDPTAIRHNYVVQSPPMTRLPRDKR